MALKFLNKKGWLTGSLRNKEKQKHISEQKKLDELRNLIKEGASVPSWDEICSDLVFFVRQRYEEELAEINTNPAEMAMVEGKEHRKKDQSKKEKRKKHRSNKSNHQRQSHSEGDTAERGTRKRKIGDEDFGKKYHKTQSHSEYESSEQERKREKNDY